MNRRPFLRTLACGGSLLTAGCLGSFSLSLAGDRLEAAEVVDEYWYDGTDLVVRFLDGVDVEEATLYDSISDETYETIERPAGTVRFPVVFPDRLETRVTGRPALRVATETPGGKTWQSVWEPVHGAARNVEPLEDGRARFDLENQGGAPLLVRFVAIYGDVPNPTIDPQSDSFDRSSFDLGPGVVGVGPNRPLTPSRTDLVVSPGETVPFETTYAPFAFSHGGGPDDCSGEERRATIAIVHGSGGSAAYGFTYQLRGEPVALEGHTAAVCDGEVSDTERR